MDQKIKELFYKGKQYKEIAKELGVSAGTVFNHVKKMGLKRRNRMTDDEKQIIINRIKNGETYTSIAKHYKRDISTISDIAKNIGYKCKNNRNRKYNLNENYFEVIDTEHKAYWLGFIFADGYISSRDNGFELSLKGSDIEHLHKFNKFMEHNKDNVKLGEAKNGDKTAMTWQVVKVYTLPDHQKAVKIMRIA